MKKIGCAILCALCVNISFAQVLTSSEPADRWEKVIDFPSSTSVLPESLSMLAFIDFGNRIFIALPEDRTAYSDDQGKTWKYDLRVPFGVDFLTDRSRRTIYIIPQLGERGSVYKGWYDCDSQKFQWQKEDLGLVGYAVDTQGLFYAAIFNKNIPQIIIKNSSNAIVETIDFHSLPADLRPEPPRNQYTRLVDMRNLGVDGLGNIYVGCTKGLYIYSRDTKTWRIEENIKTVLSDHHDIIALDKQTVYVLTEYGFIYKSTDAGKTWARVIIDPADHFRADKIIADHFNTIHIMAYDTTDEEPYSLFRLQKGGTQWIRESKGISGFELGAFALDRLNNLYVSVRNKVFKLLRPLSAPSQ